jgi:hypothetical protein
MAMTREAPVWEQKFDKTLFCLPSRSLSATAFPSRSLGTRR